MALSIQAQPNLFSWSRHPINFTFRSDAAFTNTLKIRLQLHRISDDSLIASTHNLLTDANGDVSFNWSKIITDECTGEIPQLIQTGYTHTKSVLGYYVKAIEIADDVEGATMDSVNKYAVLGANSYFTTQNTYNAIPNTQVVWLTSKPTTRENIQAQTELATVLFTEARTGVNAPVLRIVLTYTDASTHPIDTNLGDVAIGQCITVDLSDATWNFDQHNPAKTVASFTVQFVGLTGDVLTFKRKDQPSPFLRSYLFTNARGGFDALAATGELIENEEINGDVYLDDQNIIRVRQDIRRDVFEQASGFIPKTEVTAYKQMRDMNKAFRMIGTTITGISIFPGGTKVLADNENLTGFVFRYTAGDGRQDYDTINAIQA